MITSLDDLLDIRTCNKIQGGSTTAILLAYILPNADNYCIIRFANPRKYMINDFSNSKEAMLPRK